MKTVKCKRYEGENDLSALAIHRKRAHEGFPISGMDGRAER